jgi:hypothetical protein
MGAGRLEAGCWLPDRSVWGATKPEGWEEKRKGQSGLRHRRGNGGREESGRGRGRLGQLELEGFGGPCDYRLVTGQCRAAHRAAHFRVVPRVGTMSRGGGPSNETLLGRADTKHY